jgi:hypothetical protein
MLGQNPRDVLMADLVAFLVDRGGAYHDEPATLYEELASRAKPARPDELSKMIRAIAKRHDAPFTLEARNIKRDGQSRRAIKLVLGNGVNGVNGVNR